KLLDAFREIKSVKVHRAALWILGEYATSVSDIEAVIKEIHATLGEGPLLEVEQHLVDGELDDKSTTNTGSTTVTLVTSDGTYATQSAFNSVQMMVLIGQSAQKVGNNVSNCRQRCFGVIAPHQCSAALKTKDVQKKGQEDTKKSTDNGARDSFMASKFGKEKRPALRQYMMDGDFFIGAALASTLTKLALRFGEIAPAKRNRFDAEVMLIMAGIIHLGKSGLSAKPITNDDNDHILFCLKVLSDHSPAVIQIFTNLCRQSLSDMLTAKEVEEAKSQKAKEKIGNVIQTDDPVSFLQLETDKSGELGENVFETSLSQALVGGRGTGADTNTGMNKLNKITQLTGFSDPVYAEAYVHVNQYDIVLDVLIVNQTSDTLQNCTLELATLGDLKLVEKPQPVVLAPKDFCNIKANVKVASTENGIIFGNIVYDVTGAASDRNVVVLNDIHIDIMDYILPATCTDAEFMRMWAEFEWENKVTVNTPLIDLSEYLKHLLQSTNMKCLTPEKALSGQCGFMAANMYAKSIFGEDALANLSIEKPFNKPDAPVSGHIRIRAKSQGMALSLGDKINMTQKGTQTKVVAA
ncbi:hypothetical protein NQ317_014740, partial [Molorchus minor]